MLVKWQNQAVNRYCRAKVSVVGASVVLYGVWPAMMA